MKIRDLLLSGVLAAGFLAAPTVFAQSIASKVEEQGFARYAKVSALMARERDGFLTIQMEVQNTDTDPRRVFWRIRWLDEAGFQVWDDEPWKPLLLQARARQNVQSMAPTPKARDFRIQFNAEESWSTNGQTNPPASY